MTGPALLTPGLVPGCARLLSAAFAQQPWEESRGRSETEEYLTKFITFSACLALVWLEADVPTALALGYRVPGMGKDYFRLEEFCAWPQNAGYGGKLLEALCLRLAQMGMDGLILNTIRDFPARKFYEKHRFRLLTDSVCLFRSLEEGGPNQ